MVLKSPLERDRSAGIPRKPTVDNPTSTVEDALAYLKQNGGAGDYNDLTNKPTLGTASAQDVGYFATAAQGALADSAVQPGDLGTAAVEDVGAFATAAQGAKADSAVQLGDLATVATSGSYDDLTDKPALGTASALDVDTDGTLAANSDSKIATQKAVKTYADQLIAAADVMVFKGVIDCSANPDYPAADAGWSYRVSAAGKIGGASGINVEIGDILLCLADSTSSGNQATVGSSWSIAQTNIDGAVTGPASSTSGNIATFNGTSGKIIQDSGKALPSGTIVGTSDAQTLTNKTLTNAIVGTQTAGDNSTKAASTAYVDGALSGKASATVDLVFVIGDGQNVITAGTKGFFPVDFGGTIVSWTLVADASGSLAIELWKDTYANFPPTSGDKITASAGPALSSAQKNQSSTLTGWTTTFSAGDVFAVNVTGTPTTVKQATLVLKATKA